MEKNREFCSIIEGGQEQNQEESSEGGERPGNVRELAGSRSGWRGGRVGWGLAEKSVITQEVWNSDL